MALSPSSTLASIPHREVTPPPSGLGFTSYYRRFPPSPPHTHFCSLTKKISGYNKNALRSSQEAALALAHRLAFRWVQRKKHSVKPSSVSRRGWQSKSTQIPFLSPSPPILKIIMMMRRPIIFNAKCCGHFHCAVTETHQTFIIHPPTPTLPPNTH